MHRFCAASRAEPQAQLTLAAGYSSKNTFREAAVSNLKLRALPYAGVLVFVASMAGYVGAR
jgi:hypothetical protein